LLIKVTVFGLSGLTKAYRSVLSATGSLAMAGASRCDDMGSPFYSVPRAERDAVLPTARLSPGASPTLGRGSRPPACPPAARSHRWHDCAHGPTAARAARPRAAALRPRPLPGGARPPARPASPHRPTTS